MTNSTTVDPSMRGSIDPMVDRLQTLRTGLELARASQLTMLRFQLALHNANRRTALQALDDLLDVDAEMEGVAARLSGPVHHPDELALSGFIGMQKAAIAAEKHALTGGTGPMEPRPLAMAAPDEWAAGGDSNPQGAAYGYAEAEEAGAGRHWLRGALIAILILAVAAGAAALLWPAGVQAGWQRIMALVSGAG